MSLLAALGIVGQRQPRRCGALDLRGPARREVLAGLLGLALERRRARRLALVGLLHRVRGLLAEPRRALATGRIELAGCEVDLAIGGDRVGAARLGRAAADLVHRAAPRRTERRADRAARGVVDVDRRVLREIALQRRHPRGLARPTAGGVAAHPRCPAIATRSPLAVAPCHRSTGYHADRRIGAPSTSAPAHAHARAARHVAGRPAVIAWHGVAGPQAVGHPDPQGVRQRGRGELGDRRAAYCQSICNEPVSAERSTANRSATSLPQPSRSTANRSATSPVSGRATQQQGSIATRTPARRQATARIGASVVLRSVGFGGSSACGATAAARALPGLLASAITWSRPNI